MDVKTQILSTVISMIVEDLTNHKDWNPLMEYTDWTAFKCEVKCTELNSKIRSLLKSDEYQHIINHGNQIFLKEMDRQSEEFHQMLQHLPS